MSRYAVEQRAYVLGLWVLFFFSFIFSTHFSVLFTEGSFKACKRALRRKTGVIVAGVICDGLVVGLF